MCQSSENDQPCNACEALFYAFLPSVAAADEVCLHPCFVLDQQRLYHMQAMVDAATDAVAMAAAMAAAMVAATATATMGTGECASLLLDVCLQMSTSARLDLACLPPHPMLLR